MKKLKIGKKYIGDKLNTYFIADIGANHNGKLDKAIKLIHLAKESGADAAKFQNFQANKIVSKIGFDNMKGKLSHQSKWKKSVYETYEDASVNFEWTKILRKECEKNKIDFMTAPYDLEYVDMVKKYIVA